MSPYIDDPDFQLHVGDALEVLQAMPAESVHCCVTSPPYWGLRDYGTGTWDGGDATCDHALPPLGDGGTGGSGNLGFRHGRQYTHQKQGATSQRKGRANVEAQRNDTFRRDTCGKCGARRVDQQLGLEPTPDEYVANMVNVFRQVRRVLRADGTLWLNIGDSYAGGGGFAPDAPINQRRAEEGSGMDGNFRFSARVQDRQPTGKPKGIKTPGLKPKDLVGIPWRLAFALQADGWYLRSDIIWSKPNPMPESVTDRPTKAHEYLFLLTKAPRYYFDSDAIREPHSPDGRAVTQVVGGNGSLQHRDGERWPGSGRNKRSVWEIATEPYPDAHFATFPQALVEPCVKAGCPEWVCGTCGKPRERIVERTPTGADRVGGDANWHKENGDRAGGFYGGVSNTLGWSDCGHNNYQPGAVLDPFLGSGTTAQVARRLGRKCVGIELNPEYAELAARRLQQLSLFAVETAEA